jgi:MFS family permease
VLEAEPPARRGPREATRLRVAVTGVFALNGALFASLFSRMPALKDGAGLDAGELGMALFAGSAGLMASQPPTGALASRLGSRPLVMAGVVLYGGFLPLLPLASGPAGFAAVLVLLGIGSGVLDVAMNAQGALAERRHPRRIFSSFHAAFSFGALAGAAVGGAVAEAGVGPQAHFLVVGPACAAVGLLLAARVAGGHEDATPDGPRFARPSRALVALGAIGFCALFAEGAVGDWSAVLLAEEREASPGLAAAGLAAFSLTMATGRLAADPLAERFGPGAVVRGGAVLSGAGLGVALLPLAPLVGVAGFAVMGAGLAGVFPLALGAAAREPGSAPATAIAAVSASSYVGFLAGPATIGTIAQLGTLPLALATVVPLAGAAALLAPAVERRGVRRGTPPG